MIEHFNTQKGFWQKERVHLSLDILTASSKRDTMGPVQSAFERVHVRVERLCSIIITGIPLVIRSGVFAVGRVAT
jgi:hypothetical protein